MDIVGAVLVSRTWDMTSKAALVSVDVVDMDKLRSCAVLDRLRNRHDEAMCLRDDNRSEASRGGRYTC
jgi:hypothetical protein